MLIINDVTVIITADVILMICSPLNYEAVQFAKENHIHLKDIILSECISEENLPVYTVHFHWSRSVLEH